MTPTYWHSLVRRLGFQKTKRPFCLVLRRKKYSSQTLWEIVSFVRRCQGWPQASVGPGDTLRGDCFWTMPNEFLVRVMGIVQKMSDSSKFWVDLRRFNSRPVVQDYLLSDIYAAAVRDGIDVAYERLRRLIVLGEAPENPAERVLCNLVQFLRILGGGSLQFEKETPLSALIDAEVIPALLQGVDELPGASRACSEPTRDVVPSIASRAKVRRVLLETLDRAQLWGNFAFLNQIMVSEIFFERVPFARCNALIEIAMRHCGYQRLGMTALAWAPLSKIRLDWEAGTLPADEMVAPHGNALITTPFGTDATLVLYQYIEFFECWLTRVEEDLACEEGRDGAHRAAIDADLRLNLRQRELLKELVQNPSNMVDVRGYGLRFEVAMSTANTDLAKLAALGWLTAAYEGKRQVYRLLA